MLNLADKKITVIGGGEVAFRKVKKFLEFKCLDIQVISPSFIEAFKEVEDYITCIYDTYKQVYIEASYVVVAATDNRQINCEIGNYCNEKGKLCNVIDDKNLSSFIMPSYVKRGDLVLAVSTSGTSPYLAKKIRKDLERQYGEEYVLYTKNLGRLRAALLKDIKNEEEKKKMLEHITHLKLEELIVYTQKYFDE